MSNVMDRKVVEMQFDNSQFERNVKGSITTLDKLKESLKFEGVSKSIDEIDRSTGKLDFSGMRGAIETVTYKFSVLESIAFGALKRIGERATDAGIKLAKSMSVDNIKAGWSKFEEKTKSVGTLIAQGYDISLVNEQLEKLNFFTDETSYSFTNMVSEIAKFTATGKGLEDSVTAMMGIANWAAMSGQNASTASRAMFQLSQAMGSGVMRKEDYKSIQNVSMDTKEFRQRALDAGVALKTLKKNADGTYQSIVKGAKSSKFNISQFADHLTQDAWFTSDVMMKVYSEYAYAVDEVRNYMIENGVDTASEAMRQLEEINRTETDMTKKAMLDFGLKALRAAQEARSWGDTVDSVKEAVASGFSKTFEIIFGQYDEAVDLWTDLAERFYDMFATPINNFNEVLETALKGNTPYIKQYFATIAEGNDLIVDGAVGAAKKFGYSSEQTLNYVKSLAHGNDEIAKLVLNFVKLNKMAGKGDEVLGASTEKLISYTAEMMGVSEEQVESLKKIGDEFGYNSGKYSKELAKIFGAGKNGAYETVTGLLAVGEGLDVIESKDLDRYLTDTLKFTSDQVTELHKLAKEYGANSDQVDNYIKSLQNFKNFGYGNRGWTRTAIKGLLEITDELSNTELGHKTGDIVDYVSKMTGADEDSVKILYDLVKERRELTSATKIDAEAVKKNAEEIDEWASSITNGNEALKQEVLELMRVNDEMGQLSGYRNILQAFNNVWEYLAKILGTVSDAFHSVFGSLDSGEIYKFTERLRKATENLKLSDEQAEKLRRTFKGFFSIFKILGQIVKPMLIPVRAFFDAVRGGSGSLIDATASIGDWLSKLASSGVVAEKATAIFTKIGEIVRPIGAAIRKAFDFTGIIKAFKNAGGGLRGVFAVISRGISIVVEGIFDIISAITGWDVEDIKTKVLGFLDGMREKIIGILPTWDRIKEIATSVKDAVKGIFEQLGIGGKNDTSGVDDATGSVNNFADAVGNTTKNLSTFVDKAKKFFGGFKDISETITTVMTSIKESGILTGFANVFERIKTNIKDINLSDFLNTLVGVGKAGGLLALGYGFKNIGDGVREFAKAFKSNGIFGSNSIFKRDWSNTLKNFATAIALVAASFWMLSRVPADRLDQIFWIITYMIAELVGAMELLNHTMTGTGTAPALFLLAFALAVGKLVKSMVSISDDVPADRLDDVSDVMSHLILALDGLLAVAGISAYFTQGKGMLKGAMAAILYAEAISIVAKAVGKMAKDSNPENLKAAGGVLLNIAEALAMLALVVYMLGGAGKYAPRLNSEFNNQMFNLHGTVKAGALASIIALTAAIAAVVAAISLLADMPSQRIIAAAMAISGIVAVMGVVIGLLSLIKKPEKLLMISGAMLLMSTSVLVLSYGLIKFTDAMKAFASLTNDEFKKASLRLLAAAGVIAVLGIASGVASFGLITLGVALITIGAGAILLSSAFIMAAVAIRMFAETIDKFGIGFIQSFDKTLDQMAKTAKRLAVGMVKFVLDIGDSLIEELPRLRKQLVTLFKESILIVCEVLLESVGPITDTTIQVLLTLLDKLIENAPIIIDKVLIFVVQILDGVSNHIEDLVIEVMEIVIGVINGIAKRLPELIGAVANLFKQMLNGIVDALKDFKVESIEDIVKAAYNLLEISLVLGAISLVAPFAAAGIVTLAALAAELATALLAFGAISKIPGLVDLVSDGGEFLASIGSAIGKFVGGFVGGSLEEVSASLPTIGSNLSAFANNAASFISAMRDVNSSVVDGATNTALAIVAMSGAALIDSITSILGASFSWETLGTRMTQIGDAMTAFSEATANVDASRMTTMTDAATGLAGTLAVFGVTAFLDTALSFLGAKIAWDTLSDKITAIGKAMASFSSETGEIDADKFGKIADASEKLVSLITTISSGESAFKWLTEKFIGKDDMGDFGKALGQFADGIKEFSEKSSGIGDKNDDVEGAIDVANKALDFSKKLNGDGSLWDAVVTLVQDEAFKNFGLGLKDFIDGIKKFAEGCPDVVKYEEDVDKAKPLIDMVIDIFQDLVGEHSIIEAIATGLGAGAMAEFGNNLGGFMDGILAYARKCRQLTPALREAMINAETPIKGVIQHLQDLTGGEHSILKAIATGLEAGAFAEFGGNMEFFADGVLAYARKCRQLTPALRQAVENAKGTISSVISTLGELTGGEHSILNAIATGLETGTLSKFGNNLEKFGESLKKYSDSIKDVNIAKVNGATNAAKNMTSIVDAVKTSSLPNDLVNIADEAISSFSKAFDDGVPVASTAIFRFLKESVKLIRSYGSQFREVGQYLFWCLGDGMNPGASVAAVGASNAIQTIIDAVHENAVSSSTSKSFEEAGKKTGNSLFRGLASAFDTAGDAASGAANHALDWWNNLVAGPLASENLEDTVTIKPVIDLDGIQNGLDTMYKMFSDEDGFSLSGGINFARTTFDSMTDRTGDSEEVNSIEKLTEVVKGLGDKLDKPVEQNNSFNFYGPTNNEIVREVKKTLSKDIIKEGRRWA